MKITKEAVAAIAKYIDPKPILAWARLHYGAWGETAVVALAILLGSLIGGYSLDAIWSWLF